MPFFQKKGCCVFLLLSLPFLVYPQTLYFSYFDDIQLSNGAEPIEVGESDVERLIRLDLPFLLNLNDFSVLKLPEAQKDSLVKQLSERVDIDANDEETEAVGEEDAAALTEETEAVGEEDAAALTEEATEAVGEEGAAALTEEAAGAVGEEGAAALTEGAAETVGEEGAAALTEEAAETVGEEEAVALAEEAPVLNDSPNDPLFPIIGVDEASAKDAFACVVMKRLRNGFYPEVKFSSKWLSISIWRMKTVKVSYFLMSGRSDWELRKRRLFLRLSAIQSYLLNPY